MSHRPIPLIIKLSWVFFALSFILPSWGELKGWELFIYSMIPGFMLVASMSMVGIALFSYFVANIFMVLSALAFERGSKPRLYRVFVAVFFWLVSLSAPFALGSVKWDQSPLLGAAPESLADYIIQIWQRPAYGWCLWSISFAMLAVGFFIDIKKEGGRLAT